MLSQPILATVLLTVGCWAIPTPASVRLSKRASPQIDSSIPAERQAQLLPRADLPTSGAISNALQLMATARDQTSNVIFEKYFNTADRNFVNDVFSRLLGSDVGSGAPELGNILIRPGDPNEDDPAPAELVGYDTANPAILVSEDVWVYPDRDTAGMPDTCATWDEEGLTLDMYILGSILLHEYTHWDYFLFPDTDDQIIDQENGYGPENARNLDKNLAKFNADSYGWWATENLWAVICAKPEGWDIL